MVQSSCGGTVPQPKAVFAIYPPNDLLLVGTRIEISPITARKLLTAYLGGSPEEFPERYRAVSATFHVRAGLPPIFIAAGDNDHLVPYEGHIELCGSSTRQVCRTGGDHTLRRPGLMWRGEALAGRLCDTRLGNSCRNICQAADN
jgi:acetyl esterase/lipase